MSRVILCLDQVQSWSSDNPQCDYPCIFVIVCDAASHSHTGPQGKMTVMAFPLLVIGFSCVPWRHSDPVDPPGVIRGGRI